MQHGSLCTDSIHVFKDRFTFFQDCLTCPYVELLVAVNVLSILAAVRSPPEVNTMQMKGGTTVLILRKMTSKVHLKSNDNNVSAA